MHDVNWWLMALAFLLGLLLTLALMIRRVTREVPVVHTVSAGVKKPDLGPELGKAAGAVTAAGAAAAAKLHDKVGERVEHVEKIVEAGAERVEKRHAEVVKKVESHLGPTILEAAPYGQGSIRVSARTVGPAGYPIKGDKDTGRYFTEDSPDFEAIEAEVWFANEESAQKAGFLRWDAKGDATAAGLVGAAAVITESHTGDSSLVVVEGGTVEGGAVSASGAAVVSIDEVPAGPYGKGSSKAGAGGIGPNGWLIKGNADSMLFHGPDSPAYEQTIAEVWFFDEATARAAGFDKWDKNFK
jgi:hypothetical protein